jgi:hypothetical protein
MQNRKVKISKLPYFGQNLISNASSLNEIAPKKSKNKRQAQTILVKISF